MAIVIASNLRKELAGDPLFDGVSFKVERRDRVALAGPNGAGKTTLLRALAGETSIQGGELAFQKGTRVALHDQRPPLQRGLTLREYVLAGAADLIELEGGRSTYFAGPWHAWRLEKASRLQAASKAADRVGRDIERLERFVARFRASTPKMARKAQA